MVLDLGHGPQAAALTDAAVPGRPARSAADRFGWSVVVITVGSVLVSGGADGLRLTGGAVFAWLLFVGSSVHVAATLALFSFGEVRGYARRRPQRYVAVPAVLLATAVAASLALPTAAFSVVLLAFFCWQLWHYQKQNLGLASLATASARLPSLRPDERRCLVASGIGGVLALVARPGVLQIVSWRLPAGVATTVFLLAAITLAGSGVAAAACAVRRWRSATTTPAAAAVYLVAAAFPLPLVVARSPYAAIGGLTLAHGLQYLLLVGRVVVGQADARRPATSGVRLVATLAVVVAAAGVLAAASHLHGDAQLAARTAFGAYLAAVMTHFVVDAGLWRLRDEFPRRWLIQRAPQLLGVLPGDAS